MKSFEHVKVLTIEEACRALAEYDGKAVLNAGGTDLLSVLKGEISDRYPRAVVDVKNIPNLDYVEENGNTLRIGALAHLSDLAKLPLLRQKYGVIAAAAHSVGSPQIRNVATLGGNLCQEVRCWYYRYPRGVGGPIMCARKGEGPCLAVRGDNRYHAIMGGKKCFAVCPSDMATALAALDARIIASGLKGERTITLANFYNPLGNALSSDEMVREIEIPKLQRPAKQRFLKFSIRQPIDFAIVSVATVISCEGDVCTDARIALGAVASGPVRAVQAEKSLTERHLDGDAAAQAAEQALSGAKPLSRNAYKVDIAKALVEKAMLASPQQ